jgi:malonyl-CoA/methylmalonyl-CoA synthetase
MNLYQAFDQLHPENAQRELLSTVSGERWTYADADRVSARIANCLRQLGLAAGDRVTVQVEKTPQALALYLACLRAGLVYHPLNPAYTASELDYFIGNAEPGLIVCDSSAASTINTLAAVSGARPVLTLNADGSGSLSDAAADRDDTFATVERAPDDMAALLYSSGTTGRPKGIMLSHGNLLSNAQTLVKAWGFSERDRLLHALPIFHVHGLFVAIHCALLSGCSLRWLSRFDPGEVISALPDCTVMMGVPTYYTRLLAEAAFTRERCAGMRLFVSGSAPLLPETFHAFEQRTGHRILERYGMSETGMNSSNPLQGERRPGTVGPALPGVALRAVDDAGTVLPIDTPGKLQVRGPNVFKGYWRMPDKTREDFTNDGFFDTGDQASISADGYVTIVGRAKDMIISGGLNVYPKEIELYIDSIDGVLESAVVGTPHQDFGEAVVAFIVADGRRSLTEHDIVAACRSELANFKIPKRVEFIETLPRNTMGKVQKNVLREQLHSPFDGA